MCCLLIVCGCCYRVHRDMALWLCWSHCSHADVSLEWHGACVGCKCWFARGFVSTFSSSHWFGTTLPLAAALFVLWCSTLFHIVLKSLLQYPTHTATPTRCTNTRPQPFSLGHCAIRGKTPISSYGSIRLTRSQVNAWPNDADEKQIDDASKHERWIQIN